MGRHLQDTEKTHRKVARIGRISNVFRIAGAQSTKQSVDIMGQKDFCPYHHYVLNCIIFSSEISCNSRRVPT